MIKTISVLQEILKKVYIYQKLLYNVHLHITITSGLH